MSTHPIRSTNVYAAVLLLAILAGACATSARTASHADLVELVDVIPDILLDIKYATTDNFTGKVVYPAARCFLVRDAAEALGDVQEDLRPLGYRLKVFDGYRPLSVQRIFWSILPDPAYVADPAKGSRHNRGYAVDLTLTDLQGHEVAMPSGYDDFSERAHRDYLALPAEAIGHREILEQIMVRHGFIPLPTEWWHFDYRGYENKPNLDIPFDEL
ncbi:MAG: M15 family metallopeptidase [Candidatus Hydrogenedentes bacterium]|nr:M15 family metallopeptidase [Candidatus Hydrogenedentota bacterium]